MIGVASVLRPVDPRLALLLFAYLVVISDGCDARYLF